MARITIEDCIEHRCPNRFHLVQMTSIRAKQLKKGASALVQNRREQGRWSIALREIAAGLVTPGEIPQRRARRGSRPRASSCPTRRSTRPSRPTPSEEARLAPTRSIRRRSRALGADARDRSAVRPQYRLDLESPRWPPRPGSASLRCAQLPVEQRRAGRARARGPSPAPR